jgi:hypothetical protein
MHVAAMTNAKWGATVPTLIVVMVMIIIRNFDYCNTFLAILKGYGIRTGHSGKDYKVKAQYIARDFHYYKYTD